MILKIASRCDLACDYCYVYELGDASWKQQPRFISLEVIRAAAAAAGKHAEFHQLKNFRVILHGGEPLLAGTTRINKIAAEFQSAMPTKTQLQLGMQSNGSLLTEKVLEELPAGLTVGISFDGDRQATTRHRLRANGDSSHDSTVRALSLLQSRQERYGGILSVIDVANNPVATYHAIRDQSPPMVDFLLPLATHVTPPAYQDDAGATYGRWLAAVFDAWYLDRDSRAPAIRLFTIIVDRLLGRDHRFGFIGPPPVTQSLVIQSDGSAELLDALRITDSGRAVTGLSVLSSTLDEINNHPGYQQPEPCDACRECAVFTTCGGGYYPHRFSAKNGYDNPSVYCDDLMYLINHIAVRLEELSASVSSVSLHGFASMV